MTLTVLVTGFGPFPGAPFNPAARLVERLSRLRRPGLGDVRVAAHVFATRYADVDRELPALIAREKPDALLMFGLAARSRTLRVETRAHNALALLPDASGASVRRARIAAGQESPRRLRAPAMHLYAAVRRARVPVILSRDAGRYLCNYLCWRAAEAAARRGGPRIVAFIHVPAIRRTTRRRSVNRRINADDLVRAGTAILMTLAAAARR